MDRLWAASNPRGNCHMQRHIAGEQHSHDSQTLRVKTEGLVLLNGAVSSKPYSSGFRKGLSLGIEHPSFLG